MNKYILSVMFSCILASTAHLFSSFAMVNSGIVYSLFCELKEESLVKNNGKKGMSIDQEKFKDFLQKVETLCQKSHYYHTDYLKAVLVELIIKCDEEIAYYDPLKNKKSLYIRTALILGGSLLTGFLAWKFYKTHANNIVEEAAIKKKLIDMGAKSLTVSRGRASMVYAQKRDKQYFLDLFYSDGLNKFERELAHLARLNAENSAGEILALVIVTGTQSLLFGAIGLKELLHQIKAPLLYERYSLLKNALQCHLDSLGTHFI